MDMPRAGDTLLGKYVLEKPLGEGGMGVVFSARHDLLGQRVAVKLIRPEYITQGDAVARFINEARAAARIENEHVARVLDVGIIDGALPYMVLEYLDGADLSQVLQERGPLPVAECVDYLLQAIEGVAHAHAVGIVHRDLKPSNLFLAKRPDGTSRVKVLDFGISKVTGTGATASGNITRTNAMLGSPLYMSPEQLRDSKSVDQRCDIWALGVIAYQLLTNQVPFMADNAVALFAAIQESDPASMLAARSTINPALDATVLRCLKRSPADRFASVTELAVSLAPFGTKVSAQALENTKRILSLSDGFRAPAESGTSSMARTVAQPAQSSARPSAPLTGSQVQTADPWARSQPAAQAPARSSMVPPLAIAGLLVALVATSLFFGYRYVSARRSAVAVAAGSLPPAVSVMSTASAVTSPAAAQPVAIVSAVAIETRPAVVASSAAPVPQSLSPRPRPLVAASPSAAPAAAPSARPVANANCTPPYEFDSAGKKHWKAECL